MAITPQNNDAFFREVDDDLRRDRLTGFWRRWGLAVAAAVAIGLLLLALGLWWAGHRRARAGRDGERLTAVLADAEQGRAQAKDPRLAALARSPRPAYRALARLSQASITAGIDPKAAAADYRAIAADTKFAQPVRDLALIRATMIQIDTLPPAEVAARMRPLAQPGGAWFGSAGELTAVAYVRMGRRDLAGPLFAAIARDSNVPDSIRGRAAAMATSLGQTVNAAAPADALKG